MAINRKQRSEPMMHGFRGAIHIAALVAAVGLLLFQLASSIIMAMYDSYWVGTRSLAAAAFPIAVALYFAVLARVQLPKNPSRAPVINNYVVFLLWTLFVLGLDGNNDLTEFPLEELLYSLTIAFMIWRYKRQDSFRDLMACSYGILSGSLAAIILFGWNPTTM